MKTLSTLNTIAKVLFLCSVFFALWDWSSLGIKLMGTTFLLWWLVNYYVIKEEKKKVKNNFADNIEEKIARIMKESEN